MSDPLKLLKSGDSLPTSARTWNPILESARAYQSGAWDRGEEGPTWNRSADIIRVKNESGSDVGRFGILGLGDPVFPPDEEDMTPFLRGVAFRGVTPEEEHRCKFAVLLEPAAKGAVARAYVAGACPVRIAAEDDRVTSADIEPGETGHLATGGSTQILWIDEDPIPPPDEEYDGPELRWAIIRLGGGGGGLIRVQIPAGTIANGASVMVKLYKADHTLGSEEIKAYNRSGGTMGNASAAKVGLISWMEREGEYQIVQESC